MVCRAHWLQLQQHRDELQELGVKVYIVTFDEVALARKYVESNPLGWPLLIDRGRTLYKRFGMGRASWWTLLNPLSIWKYFVLWLRGVKPQKVGSDVRQLGGDVLIDPAGVVRLDHASQDPHDRPSIGSLMAMVRKR